MLENQDTHISFSTWRFSVTGIITGDVRVACQALLGETLPDKYVKGKMIYLSLLQQNFQQLPVDADDVLSLHNMLELIS